MTLNNIEYSALSSMLCALWFVNQRLKLDSRGFAEKYSTMAQLFAFDDEIQRTVCSVIVINYTLRVIRDFDCYVSQR